MGQLFAWGAHGGGLPKLGECGGRGILCLAGYLTLLEGKLWRESCSAPRQLCSQGKGGTLETFLGITGGGSPEQR
jgi:hypothetical protein